MEEQENANTRHLMESFHQRHRDIDQDKRNTIIKHLEFVLKTNDKVNLSGIKNFEDGLLLHVEDSLLALKTIENAQGEWLADLGSGGGFPGVPLAVATGKRTVLIEPIKKKCAAISDFINNESLGSLLSVAQMRSEDYAVSCDKRFDIVVTRAVAELPILVEYSAPLLEYGGRLICYKGRPTDSEMARGSRAAEICGMTTVSTEKHEIPNTGIERNIVVYQKVFEPAIRLPRKPGMAKKRPLA
jgi:16S rRNA (guanine527-N7)-methyltransferase